ncbi:MAG: DUF2807 domain-containing protein [Actinobacteria bacterium]|nr:DUF2807 domain-containing protein [Actinomycetota bacterium]MBM3713225.1 DUF2807 domain-containing protein [Actinomycetota bacterium]
MKKLIFTKVKISLKKILLWLVVAASVLMLVLSLSSCITIRINTVRGSGDIAVREFDVEGFSRLIFSGIGKVYIEQGTEESLKVEAEDNILRAISVNVKGNKLEIGLRRGFLNFVPTRDIKFYLKVKDLNDIEISGVGSIYCKKLETEKLEIKSSGIGSVELNLVADDIEILLSGAGKVTMSGEVDTQQITITGAGSYSAKDLVSNDCEIDISGAGKAVVNAVKTLDINMSGFGRVEYVGNPAITQSISGGGVIKSID